MIFTSSGKIIKFIELSGPSITLRFRPSKLLHRRFIYFVFMYLDLPFFSLGVNVTF